MTETVGRAVWAYTWVSNLDDSLAGRSDCSALEAEYLIGGESMGCFTLAVVESGKRIDIELGGNIFELPLKSFKIALEQANSMILERFPEAIG